MKQLSKGYSASGASMGRPNDNTLEGTVSLGRVAIDSQGYDNGGAYWGTGAPLWLAEDEDGNESFFRAADYQAAEQVVLGNFPGVTVEPRKTEPGEISDFAEGYLSAAIWSSTEGEDGTPLQGVLDERSEDGFDLNSTEDLINAFAPEALATLLKQCKDFQESCAEDLKDLDPSQCGHDFWLTSNGHGTGFWDRGLGEVGERLTKASKPYASDLYLGDDGKVYCT